MPKLVAGPVRGVITAPLGSARRKLELSQLTPGALQRELIDGNVDIEKFSVLVNRHTGLDLASRITDATISRTIEDSSTLTVKVDDTDRAIIRSEALAFEQVTKQKGKGDRQIRGDVKLHNRVDVQLDGLWFRLNGIEKDEDELTLIFIDREIAVLKTYNAHMISSRTKVTRAQFVLRLVRKVQEFKIPVWIPELETPQAIETSAQTPDWAARIQGTSLGIPNKNDLTVKHAKMTDSQRKIAGIILAVANNPIPPYKKASRKVQVAAIMCAMQESGLGNPGQPSVGDFNYLSSDPDKNPVGTFQQIKYWGWPATQDTATDAAEFLKRAMNWSNANPTGSITGMIEDVQGNHDGTYGKHRAEAERIVTDYGNPPTDSASANAQVSVTTGEGGDYQYFTGIPPLTGETEWKPEDWWTAIKRLASEVNWRAFFVSGTFYFISDDGLLRRQPLMVIDEDVTGVHSINGQYLQGSDSAEVTVPCDLARWVAPPGSVVQITNTGPFNGRWITSTVERSLYDTDGVITLRKNDPKLPEPATDTLQTESASIDWTGRLQDPLDTVSGSSEPITVQKSSAASAAKVILNVHLASGTFRDDRGAQDDLTQLRKIAKGESLQSQCGETVVYDARILNALVALMEEGYQIGVFAMTENHHCYSSGTTKSQHSLGKAVDISSVGKPADLVPFLAVGTGDARTTRVIKEVMDKLKPIAWDLFCNGNGGTQSDVQSHQMDNGGSVGGTIVTDHTDHIHFSVSPGGRDS